jgi:hypothetical protein
MIRRPSDFAIAAIVASLAAVSGPSCGGSDAAPTQSSCEPRDGLICEPPGFSFVRFAVAISDYCSVTDDPTSCPARTVPPAGSTTARLTEPASGKLCMAGTVATNGWAVLGLPFFDDLTPDGTPVKIFDPVAAGVAALGFTIDSPPSDGIKPSAVGGAHVELPANPGVPVVVTAPESLVVPISSFFSDGTPPVMLAPSDFQGIGFGVSAGDYDFCVHDFKFLDAGGNEVTP